jgi:hypothetical protein
MSFIQRLFDRPILSDPESPHPILRRDEEDGETYALCAGSSAGPRRAGPLRPTAGDSVSPAVPDPDTPTPRTAEARPRAPAPRWRAGAPTRLPRLAGRALRGDGPGCWLPPASLPGEVQNNRSGERLPPGSLSPTLLSLC